MDMAEESLKIINVNLSDPILT